MNNLQAGHFITYNLQEVILASLSFSMRTCSHVTLRDSEKLSLGGNRKKLLFTLFSGCLKSLIHTEQVEETAMSGFSEKGSVTKS
jgi:hypothetical protein